MSQKEAVHPDWLVAKLHLVHIPLGAYPVMPQDRVPKLITMLVVLMSIVSIP